MPGVFEVEGLSAGEARYFATAQQKLRLEGMTEGELFAMMLQRYRDAVEGKTDAVAALVFAIGCLQKTRARFARRLRNTLEEAKALARTKDAAAMSALLERDLPDVERVAKSA